MPRGEWLTNERLLMKALESSHIARHFHIGEGEKELDQSMYVEVIVDPPFTAERIVKAS